MTRITKKMPPMRHEIGIYKNSGFLGYAYLCSVERLMRKFKSSAEMAAERTTWDSVVLYAVLDYEPRTQGILSANFMTAVMKYEDYAALVDKMPRERRFFFMRGRKEYKYE